MIFRVGRRLFRSLKGSKKADKIVSARSSTAKAANKVTEAVNELDGIKKRYAADCDISAITNVRLANLLSGRLGSKWLKYRRSGTPSSVHFSKQVLLSVARTAITGRCSMPFVVEKYVHADETQDVANFYVVAEFFNDDNKVLHPESNSGIETVGFAQVLEIQVKVGLYSCCNFIAPSGATRALLSLMTVDDSQQIVLLSDFTLFGSLPAVPLTTWDRSGRRDEVADVDLERDCRAILPVKPGSEIAIQVSASSLDQYGDRAEAMEKALVAVVEFFDAKAKRISGRYAGTSASKSFQNYAYMSSVEEVEAFNSICLRAPADARWLRLKLVPWGQSRRIRLNAPILYGTLDGETARIATQLDKDSMSLLVAAERIAARQGAISFRKQLLGSIYYQTGSDTVSNKLKAVSGVLRELEPGWIPDLPVESTPHVSDISSGIRICHLHKVAYPYENSGGAIRNLNILRCQKAAAMNPYVVLPLMYPFDGEDDEGFSTRVHDRVPYFEFKWPKSGSLASDRLLEFTTLMTYSVVRSVGAHVIHAASGFRGYELALQGIALRDKLGVPLIYEVRSFHEHTWGPSNEVSLGAEYTRLRMQKEDYCMRAADHVVTISECMRQLLIERGVAQDRIDVIPNGVDEQAFMQSTATGLVARAKHGLNGHTVIGYISNMSRREGHDILIHAVAELIASGVAVKCLLVGDGQERTQLEQLASSLGIGKQVVFTGVIDHKEIHEYYCAMDLFVVPRRSDFASDYVTPLKPFEAMALGIPIVVSDRPALREIVGDTERGMLFEAGSVDSLVAVLKESLANPAQTLSKVETAKAWIVNERTWKSCCNKYVDLYAHVISRFASETSPRSSKETAGL